MRIVAAVLASSLASCNTVESADQDIEQAGKAITA